MSTYATASRLFDRDGGQVLDLATGLGRTPTGLVDHPDFFDGFLARPDIAAASILAVADVAASRYADLGQAARLANLDPVVTAGSDRLRFESFSACNGVYARFDLLPDGIDAGRVGAGTTNVDINQPLRTALAGIGRSELMHLGVGAEGLRVSTPDQQHEEREVDLPDRWIRGMAETAVLLRDVTLVATLQGPTVGQFLSGLPRGTGPGPTVFLRHTPRGMRASPEEGPGTVQLAGTTRLGAAVRIARFARRLDVYRGSHGNSAWVFAMPGGRLTLFLTSSPWRGFSGEGALLRLLTVDGGETQGQAILERLAWEPVVDTEALATATGLAADAAETGLAWLAASGRIGFDLTENSYFHRELPLDTDDALLRRNPRLRAARRLAESSAVSGGPTTWHVRGDTATYEIALTDRLRCTCAWEREHADTRGPCKHILAVLLTTHDSGGPLESSARQLSDGHE
ncbi:MAG: SWIM zinc finger family protein [Acidimicrobiales bacterium]